MGKAVPTSRCGTSRNGGFSAACSKSDICGPPFFFLTASMIVRGSIRSCTCGETEGISKDVPFLLACPNELRVQMRVVGIGLFRLRQIGRRGHQSHWRVVQPLFFVVFVLLDGPLRALLRPRHPHGLRLGAFAVFFVFAAGDLLAMNNQPFRGLRAQATVGRASG